MGQHITTKGPGDLPEPTNVPGSPAYDDSREEWIDQRADELLEQRMADREALTDAVDEVLGYSDWTDALPADMAAVLLASDAAFEAEAIGFFANLHKRVERDLRSQAGVDAEGERDAWEEAQAEMRDHYRRKAA